MPGSNVVIVESPAKAKTINKYLGRDYVVRASMGHVRDLPTKKIGVDLEHGFQPTYEPLASRKKVLAELKKYARTAGEVYLATDLDREGEAIAWHLAESLGARKNQRVYRVIFNEITKSAIQAAFEHPREIDMNKVNAQQARRILDRIVGYQVSPLLWRKVATGLSAGRVQSVAVRLIVEREREIEAFPPEEYWKIGSIFTSDISGAPAAAEQWAKFLEQTDPMGNPPTLQAQQEFLGGHNAFRAELAQWQGQKFNAADADTAVAIVKALGLAVREVRRQEDPKGKGPARNLVTVVGQLGGQGPVPKFTVRDISQRESRSRPPGPFTTAALQQAASVQLRFGASRTMRIAQQLYEGVDVPGEGSVGLITYMRTDSLNLSNEAVGQIRGMIGQQFGQAYLPDSPNRFASGERAQEAHEAIRPSDVRRTPRDLMRALSDEQYKLYDLIWKRTVACQMTPAVWKVTEADIVCGTPVRAVSSRSTGVSPVSPMGVPPMSSPLNSDEEKETAHGQDARETHGQDAHATGHATAVFKAMGRQLAFDGFLRVTGLPRTGDQLLPELAKDQPVAPLAISPTQHFTQPPPRYTEAGLVKALEADNIGRPSTYATIITTIQDRQYVEMIERSFRPTDLGLAVTDKLVKHFPKEFDVRFTAHMEDQLDQIEEAHADWVAVLQEFYGPFSENLKKAGEEMTHAKAETTPSEYKCETCGKPMVYRFSKNGRYLACTGYPDCKSTHPVDREGKKVARVEVDVACPLCGKKMILRRSRFGEFLSCSGYPECTGSLKLDRAGNVKPPSPPPLAVDVTCPKCQSKLYLRRSKRGPWLGCSKYPKCRGRLAWSALPEEQQKDLTRRLEEHEQAHPMPELKKADGTLIVGAMNAATGQVSDKPAGAREAGVNCPKCGKPMVIRAGKRGDFLACSGYPKCRNALNLDSLPDLQKQQDESATPKP